MIQDKYFRVEVLRATPNPQQLIWSAMHQCYASCMSTEDIEHGNVPKTEEEAGQAIVRHLLAGNRGHYSPIEQATISFNIGYFPHSLMQQIRTHRTGVSFSVQSFRYTSDQLIDAAIKVEESFDQKDEFEAIEKAVYLRPVGTYTNRKGHKYEYTKNWREMDLDFAGKALIHYRKNLADGMSEEHARSLAPFDVRQHFVLGCNARSLMHLLDLRWKFDAQMEAQALCDMLFDRFNEWVPDIADWYLKNRAKKARLSP